MSHGSHLTEIHHSYKMHSSTHSYKLIFKPGTRPKAARAWFLEIALVRTSVCVCVCLSVCVSAPKAINNQWCDMV